MESRQRQLRLYSSLDLFIEACRIWGKTVENEDLLTQLEIMETELKQIDVCHCTEELVCKIEDATMALVNNMDGLLKTLGTPGVSFGAVKH